MLPPVQKDIAKSYIKELENARLSLATANDPAAIKHILGECAASLQKIIVMTETTLKLEDSPATTETKLTSKDTIALLKKTHETFTELAKHQASEQPYVFADNIEAAPVRVNFKEEIKTMRKQYHVAADTTAAAETSSIIEIPDDFRIKLEQQVSNLEELLGDISMQGPEDDISARVTEIEAIVTQLKADDCKTISKKDASKLSAHIEQLSVAYPDDSELQQCKSTFKTLAQGFEDIAPKPGAM